MSDHCTVRTTRVADVPAIELANGRLTLTLVPAIGGKIVSLVDEASGREWLARNPHLPLRLPRYDGSFVEAFDSGGLDECFPSVAPVAYGAEPWRGTAIPDHGELWCQPWEVEIVESSDEAIVLHAVCHGARLPYRFERRLTLAAGAPTVALDYCVTNLTPFAMPFVWSIHPLLAIEAGMSLHLPTGVDRVRVDGSTPGFLGEAGSTCSWPSPRADIDLSRVPLADAARAAKIFTPPLAGDEAVETLIRDEAEGHTFGFRFQPHEVTHVGVWMNYGGWSGSGSPPYFNLGLEPCIGGADSLETARQLGECATLAARSSRRWSLTLFMR